MNRRILIVAAGVVIAALVGGYLAIAGNSAASSPAAPTSPAVEQVTAPVVTKPVVEATLRATVSGFGAVQSDPNDVVAVHAPRASLVGRVFVHAGDTLAQGAPLVALNTAPAEAAAFAQAKAQVAYATGELARTQRLLTQQLATKSQVAQAQSALTDAQAKLDSLQRIGAGQAQTVLKSSVAGTVTAISVEPGQELAQGASLLTIAPRTALVVLLGVEPEDAGAIHPGMPVTLRQVADPGVRITSHVKAVGGLLNAKTGLLDVLVPLDVPADAVDPPAVGAFMQGTITIGTTRQLAVPVEAVLEDAQGSYVFVVRKGVAHRLPVRTGIENGKLVGVTGALTAGEAVVVQGNYELSDGMQVREVAS